jgi:putative tricarboxylic transport membrane protein
VSEKTTQTGWLDVGIGAGLTAVGAYFATAAWRMPAGPDPSAPGPGVAPGLLGLALGLCGLFLAVQAIMAMRHSLADTAVVSDESTIDVTAAMRRKPFIAIALLTTSAFLLEPLGFMLSTFLFLLAGFIWLGNARLYAAISAAAITSVSLWLFFTKLLGVGLPFGRLVEILFY